MTEEQRAELEKLARAATPGPWRARKWPVTTSETRLETELPCINGLSAWFTLAHLAAPTAEEVGYSDGAIGSPEDNAAYIVAACKAVPDLLATIARLEAERSVTPGAPEAFDAIDVADRIIGSAYGDEVPVDWCRAYRSVTKARARLSSRAKDQSQ